MDYSNLDPEDLSRDDILIPDFTHTNTDDIADHSEEMLEQDLSQDISPFNINLLGFRPIPFESLSSLSANPPTFIPTSSEMVLNLPTSEDLPKIIETQGGFQSHTQERDAVAIVPEPQLEIVRAPVPKKRTPKKQMTSSTPSSSKDLRNYVSKLMELQVQKFPDQEFAERALMNLARKISTNGIFLEDLMNSVRDKNPNTGCVIVSRPKDGRLTVTKSAGVSSCKKVFPQVLICQLFRWPHIVFHHDIRSAEVCSNPAAVKPLAVATSHFAEDGTKEDSDAIICINPYHYTLTPEAETRFRKANARAEKLAKVEVKSAVAPVVINLDIQEKADSRLATVDESMSSDDASSTTSDDDQSVDYVTMWEEKSVEPPTLTTFIRKFDFDTMVNDVRFLTFDANERNVIPAEESLLETIEAKKEIRDFVITGKLIKAIIGERTEVSKDSSESEPHVGRSENTPETGLNEEKLPLAEPQNSIPTSFLKSVSEHPTTDLEAEDANSIQDILADIQDSFSRQLDEEFHEMSSNDGFPPSQIFNPTSTLLDMDPGVVGMPSIVNSWTMPDEGSNLISRDDLIGASGSLNQDELENIFNQRPAFIQPPGSSGPSHEDQFRMFNQ